MGHLNHYDVLPLKVINKLKSISYFFSSFVTGKSILMIMYFIHLLLTGVPYNLKKPRVFLLLHIGFIDISVLL